MVRPTKGGATIRQRVGTCSVCGGDVYGHRGAWWSILPPPPDECAGCSATSASDVIKMHPRPGRTFCTVEVSTTTNHSRWPR